MLADLVLEGARTLAFVRSRRGAELTALGAQRLLADVDPELVDRVAAYRGGYLPEERRALEAALASGELLGRGDARTRWSSAWTSPGWTPWWWPASPAPGRRSGSRPGRAGRAADEALVVLVARDDPMDTYLVHHPQALLGAPVEGCVLDPANPYVLAPAAGLRGRRAAAHRAWTSPTCSAGAAPRRCSTSWSPTGCCAAGPTGWFWPSTAERPAGHGGHPRVRRSARSRSWRRTPGGCSARSTAARRPATVHAGAVYLHRGESYLVDELDLDAGLALVHAADPDWRTDARSTADVAVPGCSPTGPRPGAGVVRRGGR